MKYIKNGSILLIAALIGAQFGGFVTLLLIVVAGGIILDAPVR